MHRLLILVAIALIALSPGTLTLTDAATVTHRREAARLAPAPRPRNTVPPTSDTVDAAIAPVAPKPTPRATPRASAARREPVDAFVVGDSLTVGADPWLEEAAGTRGVRVTDVDASVGRATSDGISALRERAATLPDTVVVALGTNDLAASASSVATWLRDAHDAVGDRRLIWVNVRCGPAVAVGIAACARVNAALAAAAPRYDVELADWDAWASAHGIDPLSDGVHYDANAYRERAGFYAEVIASRS